jgi:hypothetical protein
VNTERAAYATYAGHTVVCSSCLPSKGVLCDEGFALHEAWRRASLQQPRLTQPDVDHVRPAARRRERALRGGFA